jgi:nicotinamidase-related amidase
MIITKIKEDKSSPRQRGSDFLRKQGGFIMKKTLVVVDMQKDFIDGALGTKEAVAIVNNVKNKIAMYKENGDEIIFTRDTHQENYMETNEGKHLPVVHCIEGTEGWKIGEGLEVEGALYIDKPSFGYMNWKDYDLEEVEIIGLCTDICVVSNALIIKATYPEIKVTVDASCCAGVTPETHKAALTTMKMCQVEVIGE